MVMGGIASSIAFVFTTFATQRYVDEKHVGVVRELDQLHSDNVRIESKVDKLLERKKRQ